ncbi:ATP12 family chaperone protein [Acetobacter sp.]|uniref:ATP12 family chaperone protein n=1 Tax=Acetobacter sp. TaxID=440 RepID=UPI0039EC3E78
MSKPKRISADGPAPHQRFWKQAEVMPMDGDFAVALDGKPVRLPEGSFLKVHSHALADTLAGEWNAAGMDDPKKRFTAGDLPLTRIVGTMIERVAPHRQHSVDTLSHFGMHDLLCYRASPAEPLGQRQVEQWQPWLDWIHHHHHVSLIVTHGLMPVKQPEEALEALKAALSQYSNEELAGLGVAVPALGSLVLGMALAEDKLEAEKAVALATLDEQTQMERWGVDAAQLDRIATIGADVADAARFMDLAREK